MTVESRSHRSHLLAPRLAARRATREPSRLTRLANATVRALDVGTPSRGPVGVIGDLDRRGRVRTTQLRHKLTRRGVTTVDLSPRRPPRHDEATQAVDEAVVLVVDVAAQHALATQLAVTHDLPLVTFRPFGEATDVERTSRGVIRLRSTEPDDHLDDVALSEVEIRPESPDICRLAVHLTRTESVRTLQLPPGTLVRVTPRLDALAVEADLPARDQWRGEGQTVTVAPEWGNHTITRDGVPIAHLQAPLTLSLHGSLELYVT